MIEYLSIKGIYEKGSIRLLEKLTHTIDENAEVTVLIPVNHASGIKLPDFLNKINNCALGGDAVAETKELSFDMDFDQIKQIKRLNTSHIEII